MVNVLMRLLFGSVDFQVFLFRVAFRISRLNSLTTHHLLCNFEGVFLEDHHKCKAYEIHRVQVINYNINKKNIIQIVCRGIYMLLRCTITNVIYQGWYNIVYCL